MISPMVALQAQETTHEESVEKIQVLEEEIPTPDKVVTEDGQEIIVNNQLDTTRDNSEYEHQVNEGHLDIYY